MLLSLWAVKGGSGTSTVAAGLAAVLGRGAETDPPLLVDLDGDQPALLGLAEPAAPGALDWLATDGGDVAALRRLAIDSGTGPALVPAGAAVGWPSGRAAELAAALASERRPVVVDAGTVVATAGDPGSGRAELVRELGAVGTSLLVVRPCYLALRRAVAMLGDDDRSLRADGVVVVAEPGRALDAVDVARAVGVPVRVTVAVDPAVARAVDAGLLAARLPRPFGRALGALVAEVHA